MTSTTSDSDMIIDGQHHVLSVGSEKEKLQLRPNSKSDLSLEQLITLYRSGQLPPQSQMFLKIVMEEMPNLHLRKAAGYGRKTDTWANFRGSERLGVPTWKAVLIRIQDKMSRVENLALDPANDLIGEGLEKEAQDAAAYFVIEQCLLREQSDGNAPE